MMVVTAFHGGGIRCHALRTSGGVERYIVLWLGSLNGTYFDKVRACNTKGCSDYSVKSGITVDIPLPMVVRRFEWASPTVKVGTPTTFYWDVENAD
ncbi:MAG: hypothetical protein COA42_11545 [Alteromonadaceae bacterium]|nr:MAG: hypothetical protein COA42_11545 [Alteromonadaceae bacterium]